MFTGRNTVWWVIDLVYHNSYISSVYAHTPCQYISADILQGRVPANGNPCMLLPLKNQIPLDVKVFVNGVELANVNTWVFKGVLPDNNLTMIVHIN